MKFTIITYVTHAARAPLALPPVHHVLFSVHSLAFTWYVPLHARPTGLMASEHRYGEQYGAMGAKI